MYSHHKHKANNVSQVNVDQVLELLKDKYQELDVKWRKSKTVGYIDILLLNGLHGVDDALSDEVNKKPIQFFKLHGATVKKEAHEHHSYYSYSVITLDAARVSDVIAGLDVMPSIPKPETISVIKPGREMMRC